MARFYVAKVVRTDGSRSRLLALFAADVAQAQRLVSESVHGRRYETIHVDDLAPEAQGFFNRWTDDNNGVIEHQDLDYADNTVFGSGRRE